ncbi:hypothetical protein PGTUg99_024015 [Puccinia graminis f. sp. tritici]|uniref:Uncharacterized protein n=1 Tax=Puccinia graminis f. sp. tritici TaxID=56615 RepID=A0A5B0QSP0_PUCGR|nr:hypothetical protein PGTUg99_024015 [Puccinia graminis f. sp. tritici]
MLTKDLSMIVEVLELVDPNDNPEILLLTMMEKTSRNRTIGYQVGLPNMSSVPFRFVSACQLLQTSDHQIHHGTGRCETVYGAASDRSGAFHKSIEQGRRR